MEIENIKDLLVEYSKEVLNEIMAAPVINIENAALKMALRMQFILHEVTLQNRNETKEKYEKLVDELNDPKTNSYRYTEIQKLLSTMKAEVRKASVIEHIFYQVNNYDALRVFIVEKYGSDILREFDELRTAYIQIAKNRRLNGELKNRQKVKDGCK